MALADFDLIEKTAEPSGIVRLKYGVPGDPLPFILTVTSQYVAHKTSKTLPIKLQDVQDYINKNAEYLKQIAENGKARGRISAGVERSGTRTAR